MCMLHVLRRSQSTCLQYVNIDIVIFLFYIPYIVILGREIQATNMYMYIAFWNILYFAVYSPTRYRSAHCVT